MREIRFRAWDKEQGKMFYDGDKYFHANNHYSVYITNKGIHWCPKIGVEIEVGDMEIDHIYTDVELMQCTGLSDRLGKEIYEGDIVRHTRLYNTSHISIGKVIFRKGMFELSYGNLIYKNFKDCDKNYMVLEVIGNIFELPELLEVE